MRAHRLAALFLVASAASALRAQPARDSTYRYIAQLASQSAEFHGSQAIGEFTGNKAPFMSLITLFERNEVTVLTALTDCFGDTRLTTVRYHGAVLSRGGLCYLALHNLVYHEHDDLDWTGNYFGKLSRSRLLAAQRAWRKSIRNHAYSPS